MTTDEIPQNITLEDLTRLVFMSIANSEKREAARAVAEAERAAAEKQRAAAEEQRRAEQAARDAEFATAEEKRRAELAAAEKQWRAEQAVAEEKRRAEFAAAEEKRRAELAAAEKQWRAEQAVAEEKRRVELAAEEKQRRAEQKRLQDELAAAEAARVKSSAALDRQIKRVDKQLGDLHNKFGRMEEIHMVPSVIKLLNKNGYDFKERMTSRNIKIENDERVLSEIDAVINNTATTALLEVKTSVVKVKDIEHHIRRLQIYRANCERKQIPVKELIGVLAGLEFEDGAKAAAIEAGFFVVVPDGKRIKFDVPEGFKAKNY